MNQSMKKNENEIKKIKEQRLVEESDNKLSEDLFSNNPYVIDKSYKIDKSDSINIVKLGKNKFVSVIKPIIIEEKTIKPITVKPVTNLKNKCYDLNDYDYDFDFSDFE